MTDETTRPDVEAIRKRARMTNWDKEADVLACCDWIVHLELRSPEPTMGPDADTEREKTPRRATIEDRDADQSTCSGRLRRIAFAVQQTTVGVAGGDELAIARDLLTLADEIDAGGRGSLPDAICFVKAKEDELWAKAHRLEGEDKDAAELEAMRCWKVRELLLEIQTSHRPAPTPEAEPTEDGVRGFVIDVSNQPCRMEAEGASPDFPCSQTSACATEWCDPCRARMVLGAASEARHREDAGRG